MGNVIFDEKMAGRLMQNLMTFDVRIVRLPGEGFKAEPRAPTPQLQAGSLPWATLSNLKQPESIEIHWNPIRIDTHFGKVIALSWDSFQFSATFSRRPFIHCLQRMFEVSVQERARQLVNKSKVYIVHLHQNAYALVYLSNISWSPLKQFIHQLRPNKLLGTPTWSQA